MTRTSFIYHPLTTAVLTTVAIIHALAVRAWPHLWAWFAPEVADPAGAPTVDHGRPAKVDYASLLEALTVRDLRATCVTLGLPSKAYRTARKAELVAMLAELSVNPTL